MCVSWCHFFSLHFLHLLTDHSIYSHFLQFCIAKRLWHLVAGQKLACYLLCLGGAKEQRAYTALGSIQRLKSGWCTFPCTGHQKWEPTGNWTGLHKIIQTIYYMYLSLNCIYHIAVSKIKLSIGLSSDVRIVVRSSSGEAPSTAQPWQLSVASVANGMETHCDPTWQLN